MIAKLLYKLTAGLPCKVIRPNGKPYLERYYLGTVLGMRFYLHRIMAPDNDPQPHDHPWRWSVGLPLCGGYTEDVVQWLDPVLGPKLRRRRIRTLRPNLIQGGKAHRVALVQPNTWTLFAHGAKVKEWGFLHFAPGALGIVYANTPDMLEGAGDWYMTAPPGRAAGREPFRALGDYESNALRCHSRA